MQIFTKKQWFKLPLKLRQKWWKETDYGKLLPSLELQEQIKEELKKLN
jgi:hypothetical protein